MKIWSVNCIFRLSHICCSIASWSPPFVQKTILLHPLPLLPGFNSRLAFLVIDIQSQPAMREEDTSLMDNLFRRHRDKSFALRTNHSGRLVCRNTTCNSSKSSSISSALSSFSFSLIRTAASLHLHCFYINDSSKKLELQTLWA